MGRLAKEAHGENHRLVVPLDALTWSDHAGLIELFVQVARDLTKVSPSASAVNDRIAQDGEWSGTWLRHLSDMC